jgi:hypothetical protein
MADAEEIDYAWTEEELSGCLRFDRASTLPGATRTPEGFLRVYARIAKVGVMKYPGGYEFVPASTLSDPEFLHSLENKPIFIEHPTNNSGRTILVTSKNIAKFDRVGTVLSPVTFDGEYVIAPLQIEREDAINAISKGLREVSPGYLVPPEALVNQEGVYQGQPYTRIQTRRRAGNHVVLTKKGRGGSDIALSVRGDSAADIQESEDQSMNPVLAQLLAACGLKADAYPDDAAAGAAIQAQIAGTSSDLSAARAEMDALKAKIPQMEADLSAAKLRYQELTEKAEELEEGEEMVDSMIAAGPAPKADAMVTKAGAKMDAAKAEKKAANLAKAHKKIADYAKQIAKLDAAAADLKIPDADKMSLAEKTKAVAMRTDSTVSDSESLDYYRAIVDRGPRAVARDPGRTLGATVGNPQVRTDSATRRKISPSRLSLQTAHFPSPSSEVAE